MAGGEIAGPPVPLSERFGWQAGALALLVLIAYTNSLASGFHLDDDYIFMNPWVVGPGFGLNIFRLDLSRHLTWLTFHWNYLLGGMNPFGYHLINMLLHAGNSILVLALARKYLQPFTAVCVAALFAVHPLQTEAVTYVYARSTLLSTHFALWTLWFRNRGKFMTSALLFGVSLLAKEEAIALPALLLLLDLFERKRPKAGYFALLFGLAALAAGHLLYLIRTLPAESTGVGQVHGVTTGAYLLTQARVLWIYLRLLVAPIDLNLVRDLPLSSGMFSPWTTLPAVLATTALLLALAWLTWKKHIPAALWGLGAFVLLSPSSSIVAQADLIFEHRTYLPMICLVISAGFLLEVVPRAKLAVASVVLVPVMMAGTISRNADWHDEQTFWKDVSTKSPNKTRTWLGLANAYRNDPVKWGEYLKKGLTVDPDSVELRANYGIFLLGQNRLNEALPQFQRARELGGDRADILNDIGATYLKLNDPDGALGSFQRALALDPCQFSARLNIMRIYAFTHDQHAVWQTGAVPSNCTLLPDQTTELETLRRNEGRP